MNLLAKINAAVEKAEKFVISVSVIIMAVLLIGNVIMRVIVNDSWAFTDEVGRFLVVTMTFIGSAYAARIGRHIRMSAIYDMLPARVRRVLMTLISFVTALGLFVVTYYCFEYVQFLYESGRVSNSLRIPMYLVMIFVPIGMFLMSVQYLLTAVTNLVRKDGPYVSPLKKDTEAEDSDQLYSA
ncbi:MAG: TRAP transporter small permease [Brevibacillus sp.]|nr:TRAP transporter small permease [Brevibacillus sp.]